MSTIISIPPKRSFENDSKTNSRQHQDIHPFDCPKFTSEDEYDKYVESISPSRELVCPITQELLRDPVVAEDGHTYERTSMLRWFSMGRSRSPVTNSLMEKKALFPNLACQTMAQAHREKLGVELVKRASRILENNGQCDDGGERIIALLDAGADTSTRGDPDSSTTLQLIIRSGHLPLARAVLPFSSVHKISDENGLSVIEAAEKILTRINSVGRTEWKQFSEELKSKGLHDEKKSKEREEARTQANQDHRQRQRSLAADARDRRDISNLILGGTGSGNGTIRGLGNLEEGWGYFPSLAALQFQSSVPLPPRSVAEDERKVREKLDRIIRGISFVVLIYFIFC
mmetsp:Transcript_45561/g.53348  ORF Transcript_45561/g.53348 Transcript_45561/m.53348 type:complete len:344 (-) Transcript_45561:300-1331(-)